jgi:hypothetical protein
VEYQHQHQHQHGHRMHDRTEGALAFVANCMTAQAASAPGSAEQTRVGSGRDFVWTEHANCA